MGKRGRKIQHLFELAISYFVSSISFSDTLHKSGPSICHNSVVKVRIGKRVVLDKQQYLVSFEPHTRSTFWFPIVAEIGALQGQRCDWEQTPVLSLIIHYTWCKDTRKETDWNHLIYRVFVHHPPDASVSGQIFMVIFWTRFTQRCVYIKRFV